MSDQQQRTGGRLIGPDTKLTIASALSVAAVVVVATWKMSATLTSLDTTLRTLARQAWTISDQERFANRLERHNPPLKVPDTTEILRARPTDENGDGVLPWAKPGNMLLWDVPTWEADPSPLPRMPDEDATPIER